MDWPIGGQSSLMHLVVKLVHLSDPDCRVWYVLVLFGHLLMVTELNLLGFGCGIFAAPEQPSCSVVVPRTT